MSKHIWTMAALAAALLLAGCTAKKEKVAAFASTLFSQGGPAVDTIVKLFGREAAERLILHHMYGVE